MNIKERSSNYVLLLEREYPDADTALNHRNPLQMLVATIMSAQTTDKQVNVVTKELFRKYKTAQDYANAPIEELEKDINQIGLFRSKAKSIQESCKMIVRDFGGKVPDRMEDLVKLRGVARKTANIVLYHSFAKQDGIAVDTHVKRVSFRMGLTKHKDPVKIEKDLMKLIPQSQWGKFSCQLIELGREFCTARKKHCGKCLLNKLCPSSEV